MSVSYPPNRSAALGPGYAAVAPTYNDPGASAYSSQSPTRVDARFGLNPFVNEILLLQQIQYMGGGAIQVRNATGGTLNNGPVRISGYYADADSSTSTGNPIFKIVAADASGNGFANALLLSSLADGTTGIAYIGGDFTPSPALDTTGGAVGDNVYVKSGGGMTLTAPSGADEFVQVIGQIKTVNGTGVVAGCVQTPKKFGSSFLQANAIGPTGGYSIFDDFVGDAVSPAAAVSGGGLFGLFDLSSGAGAVVETRPPLDNTSPGVIVAATGTTNAGIGYADTLHNSFPLGAIAETWEWRVQLANLSTGGERYTARFGLGDGNSDPEVSGSNAILFRYCDNVNSGKWQIITASGAVLTTQDSGVAAVAGSWVTFKIAVNAAGTRVDFYINGTNVGNSTTNIYTGTTGLELFLSITKSVGTTSREMYQDYTWLQMGASSR